MSGAALAPDPLLPQRDRLLEPSAFGARLARLLGRAAPLPCTRIRAKYRVGESLRVLHRVVLDGAPVLVAARAFRAGASGPALARLRGRARPASARLPVLHDAEQEALLFPFPHDRKLDGLERLCDADWLRGWLDLPLARAELVSWVPEKGAVGRGLDAAGRARCYVKRYGEGYEHALAIQCALARWAPDAAPLRLPALLGGEPGQRMVAVAAAPGRRLCELRGAAQRRAVHALGAALAALHALPAPLPLERFGRLAPARLDSAAERLAAVRPELAARANALARTLRASAPASRQIGLVHGDVHAKNALWDGAALWLLDPDQLGLGSPALDLGSALAAFAASRDPQRAACTAALLDGYATGGTLPTRFELGWHVAAALLVERVGRAVSRVREADLARLPALLGLAERRLEETADA